MAEVFRTRAQVRFAHCDAAGIIFYPRAFELVNGAVEDWFAAMGKPFGDLHLKDGLGVPVVRLETEFVAPLRLGDVVDFEIAVAALGKSSADIEITARVNGTDRVRVRQRAVFVRLNEQKSVPIPDALRAQMQRYLRQE